MFHVDSFTCTVTQKGRSPIVEVPEAPQVGMGEGLLVLASVEAGDEAAEAEIVTDAASEVRQLTSRLKANVVMLLPFAHLFADPAPPAAALTIIDGVAAQLRSGGLEVHRPPFGWFHRWDLQAKGHPLSRVARRVGPRHTRGDAAEGRGE